MSVYFVSSRLARDNRPSNTECGIARSNFSPLNLFVVVRSQLGEFPLQFHTFILVLVEDVHAISDLLVHLDDGDVARLRLQRLAFGGVVLEPLVDDVFVCG